jgi:hypothetical protein
MLQVRSQQLLLHCNMPFFSAEAAANVAAMTRSG